MRPYARYSALLCAALTALAIGIHGPTVGAAITLASPESVGFSARATRRTATRCRRSSATGGSRHHHAGGATGKVAQFDAYGYQDLDAKKPLARDRIFRIASMTKPVTGVAMMMLFEEGKWTLDDPVAKHIPEFKDLQGDVGDGRRRRRRTR